MHEIKYILKEYASFETKVQEHLTAFCSPYCSSCSNVCCKPEYCQETTESPFLNLLKNNFQQSIQFSKGAGWLGATGCKLFVGRPPVCYEFMCNAILDAQPTAAHEYVTQILSKLISHIGKNAAGGSHIVEIMSASKLQRIKIARFNKKLGEAKEAYLAVLFFLQHNFLKATSLPALSKIHPPCLNLVRDLNCG